MVEGYPIVSSFSGDLKGSGPRQLVNMHLMSP